MEQRTLLIDGLMIYCYSNGSIEFRDRRSGKMRRTFGCTSCATGYAQVRLSYKYYRVHRLIAMAFHSNPSNFTEVDHINRNTLDNRSSNLRWCDRTMNANNLDRIDKEIEKYGVRRKDDIKAWRKAWYKDYKNRVSKG